MQIELRPIDQVKPYPKNQDVVRTFDNPKKKDGHLVVLYGNLAETGAVSFMFDHVGVVEYDAAAARADAQRTGDTASSIGTTSTCVTPRGSQSPSSATAARSRRRRRNSGSSPKRQTSGRAASR